MSLIKIAWRSIQQRALSSALTALAMAMGVTLVVAVLVTYSTVSNSFRQAAEGYHIIVGGKGSPMGIVLSTVYFTERPSEPMPWRYYTEFLDTPERTGRFSKHVDVAIPYCLGDNYEGFRVVGTIPELFTQLGLGVDDNDEVIPYRFAQGRNFASSAPFEAVIGHQAARKTGLKLGETFEITHGLGNDPGKKHHDPFTVVGILAPTGTPNDRAVFVNMEGFFLLEGHAKPVEDARARERMMGLRDDEKRPGAGEAAGEDGDQANHDKAPGEAAPGDAAPAEGLAVKEQDDRLVITHSSKPVAEFVFRDEKILRPYFANLHARGGFQVTRHHPPTADDANDHAEMHPGFWLGFGKLSGEDFWRNKGRIVHQKFSQPPVAKKDKVSFESECELVSADGKPMGTLTNRCAVAVRPAGFLVTWEATLKSSEMEIVLGDEEEMGFGVRLSTPLTEKNGGAITNSEGKKSAAETWGQGALWCDYSGTIEDRHVGITLMPHPDNFRPSWWHNRDYGLMVANPFGRAALKQGEPSAVTVKQGQPFTLSAGAMIYASEPGQRVAPAEAYQQYVQWHEPLPEEQREVTSILVRLNSSLAGVILPRIINEEPVATVASPVDEINKLLGEFVDPIRWLLLGLTCLIVLVAGIGILVSIYNSMSERRREIAIMRSLGANRGTVLSIILLESILLSLAGGVAGVLLGHLLVGALNPLLVQYSGTSVGFLQWSTFRVDWGGGLDIPWEAVLIPSLVVLASIVGLLPAISAYRTDVSRALQNAH